MGTYASIRMRRSCRSQAGSDDSGDQRLHRDSCTVLLVVRMSTQRPFQSRHSRTLYTTRRSAVTIHLTVTATFQPTKLINPFIGKTTADEVNRTTQNLSIPPHIHSHAVTLKLFIRVVYECQWTKFAVFQCFSHWIILSTSPDKLGTM